MSTERLKFSIGRSAILHDISLRFRPGRFTALVGANGSGKSSLMRCLIGLAAPEAGRVLLDGRPLASQTRRQIARRLAYLPQSSICPDHLTVGELVELAGFARTGLFGTVRAADREGYREALRTVGLAGKAARQLSRLSGGERQRAFIALALAQDTPVLLMDEPVNHLDLKYQYAVLDLLRDLVTGQGKTLVVVLHDLNLALAYADDAVLLKQGRVLAQGPARQVLDARAVAEGFGIAADLRDLGGRRLCLPKGAQMIGMP
nr:ABC transporter ATP-binding protein [Salipiger mangrovisoli]